MSIWTRAFWKATAERCASTFAEVLLGFIGVDALVGFGDVSWDHALSVSGLATVAAVLKALLASRVGTAGPSLANEVMSPPAPKIEAVD